MPEHRGWHSGQHLVSCSSFLTLYLPDCEKIALFGLLRAFYRPTVFSHTAILAVPLNTLNDAFLFIRITPLRTNSGLMLGGVKRLAANGGKTTGFALRIRSLRPAGRGACRRSRNSKFIHYDNKVWSLVKKLFTKKY